MASAALYRRLAIALSDALRDETTRLGVAVAARAVADVLKADNPRFRYDAFFDACGLDPYGVHKES